MLSLWLAILACSITVLYGLYLQRKILIEERNHTFLLTKIDALLSERNLILKNAPMVSIGIEKDRPKQKTYERTEESKRKHAEAMKKYWENKKKLEKVDQKTHTSQEASQAINA